MKTIMFKRNFFLLWKTYVAALMGMLIIWGCSSTTEDGGLLELDGATAPFIANCPENTIVASVTGGVARASWSAIAVSAAMDSVDPAAIISVAGVDSFGNAIPAPVEGTVTYVADMADMPVTITYTMEGETEELGSPCVFMVVLSSEDIGPTFTNCPSDQILLETELTGTVTWSAITATDNVDDAAAINIVGVDNDGNALATPVEGAVSYEVSDAEDLPVGIIYTATDTDNNVATCVFGIRAASQIQFEFPASAATIEGKSFDNGDFLSASNPFTCREPKGGSGDVVCEQNPMFIFNEFGSQLAEAENSDENSAVITIYEKVEVEIVYGSYQSYFTGNDNTDYTSECDGPTVSVAGVCVLSLIATELTPSNDTGPEIDESLREIRKTSSSVELMRLAGTYGTGGTRAERTLREDITHLWPYLQGRFIFLSMNNNYAPSVFPIIEEIRIILTPYKTRPIPGDGTLLPYRVLPAWGNGVDPNAGDGHPNEYSFYLHRTFFGEDSANALLSDSRFSVPEIQITGRDVTNLAEVRAFVYSTGRGTFEFSPYRQNVYLDTDRDLGNGTLKSWEIDIDSDRLDPASASDPYNRQLMNTNTFELDSGRRLTSQYNDRRAGWLPGRRVPFYELAVSQAEIGALAENDEWFLNMDIASASREELSRLSRTTHMDRGIHAISGLLVFYSAY